MTPPPLSPCNAAALTLSATGLQTTLESAHVKEETGNLGAYQTPCGNESKLGSQHGKHADCDLRATAASSRWMPHTTCSVAWREHRVQPVCGDMFAVTAPSTSFTHDQGLDRACPPAKLVQPAAIKVPANARQGLSHEDMQVGLVYRSPSVGKLSRSSLAFSSTARAVTSKS